MGTTRTGSKARGMRVWVSQGGYGTSEEPSVTSLDRGESGFREEPAETLDSTSTEAIRIISRLGV